MNAFSLPGLLRIASLFGLDLDHLRDLAIREGLPVARKFVMDYCQRTAESAVPKIVKNLKDKAPLDGQRRKDKDGVEFSDWEFLAHESLYLIIKAVIKKGGAIIDHVRDSDLNKVLQLVSVAPDLTTPEAVVRATLAAEMQVVF
jgi:hypothetical protein